MKYIKINSKYINQQEFNNAIDVLNSCYETKINYGLVKPYFKPGSCPIHKNDYGDLYWSLDYALAVDGAMLLDLKIGEDFVENMFAVQEENGRIKLYSADYFTNVHGNFNEKISSLPKLLQTLYKVALKTSNQEIKEKAYIVMSKNLFWWYKNRQDKKTKLISAVFEETFAPYQKGGSFEYCPMDTNIEIYLGSKNASSLAKTLNKKDDEIFFFNKANEILNAIDKYLWDEEDEVYYPYLLKENKRQKIKLASCFLGLYINKKDRQEKLIKLLNDSSEFNYDTFPITTVSKKDKNFNVIDGDYNGNPCWLGSVWTLTNYAVIKALKDNGFINESKDLVIKTINIFKNNYAEFINPLTGKGNGMQKYAWTASQFIQIILEELN